MADDVKAKVIQCDHVYKKAIERVMPSRTNEKQPEFTGSGAYFTYNVCKKCGKKLIVDYAVEK